ncbi:MAG: hypothetical protein ISR91_04430 [Candidatus Delongbacteria bacterium]|nr:hypothetical protein [Candidatus Delongbacteria bacterium]
MQRYATSIAVLAILVFGGQAQAVWQVGQQVTTNFTLNDVNGQSHSLFDYQGQCVLINFFTLT